MESLLQPIASGKERIPCRKELFTIAWLAAFRRADRIFSSSRAGSNDLFEEFSQPRELIHSAGNDTNPIQSQTLADASHVF
jgi:hypothetical protein